MAVVGAVALFISCVIRLDSSNLCLTNASRVRGSSARAGDGLTVVFRVVSGCGGGFSAGPLEVQAVSQKNVSASSAPCFRLPNAFMLFSFL